MTRTPWARAWPHGWPRSRRTNTPTAGPPSPGPDRAFPNQDHPTPPPRRRCPHRRTHTTQPGVAPMTTSPTSPTTTRIDADFAMTINGNRCVTAHSAPVLNPGNPIDHRPRSDCSPRGPRPGRRGRPRTTGRAHRHRRPARDARRGIHRSADQRTGQTSRDGPVGNQRVDRMVPRNRQAIASRRRRRRHRRSSRLMTP